MVGAKVHRFNSNLVRLIVSVLFAPYPNVICFNSNLVRLIGGEQTPEGVVVSVFQFQSGAINSGTEKPNIVYVLPGFNSNLVRLIAILWGKILNISSVSIPIWCD